MPAVVDGHEPTAPQFPTPNWSAEYVPAATMTTSPHLTEWFGVRQGPQVAPHAVADVPLLLSLPLEAMKYVCRATKVEFDVGVGVGVAVGVGVECGGGVEVGVGVPVARGDGVALDCGDVEVERGEGVLLPALQATSVVTSASDASTFCTRGDAQNAKVDGGGAARSAASVIGAALAEPLLVPLRRQHRCHKLWRHSLTRLRDAVLRAFCRRGSQR
jgi:hypothetical protein